MLWPWSELGLSGPAGAEEIKHAYAKRLEGGPSGGGPGGFQRLHRAYQVARRLARVSGRPADPQIGREEPKNDDTEQPEDSKTDTAALETAAAQEETQEEPTAEAAKPRPIRRPRAGTLRPSWPRECRKQSWRKRRRKRRHPPGCPRSMGSRNAAGGAISVPSGRSTSFSSFCWRRCWSWPSPKAYRGSSFPRVPPPGPRRPGLGWKRPSRWS